MKEDKLYAIAMSCAQYRDQGCSCQCGVCQFNVFNYVSDVREASLLKANAYTDYQNRQQIAQRARDSAFAGFMGPILAVGIIIGFIVWIGASLKSCVSPSPKHVALDKEWSYEAPSQTAPSTSENGRATILQFFMHDKTNTRPLGTVREELARLAANQNIVYNVPRILLVMRHFNLLYDTNGDGLIDCIDYSVIFRTIYGSNARLIINNNPQTGMNHMFVRIRFNSADVMDIEPQGTPDRYAMGMVWGTKYNPAYNRDVTAQWGQ